MPLRHRCAACSSANARLREVSSARAPFAVDITSRAGNDDSQLRRTTKLLHAVPNTSLTGHWLLRLIGLEDGRWRFPFVDLDEQDLGVLNATRNLAAVYAGLYAGKYTRTISQPAQEDRSDFIVNAAVEALSNANVRAWLKSNGYGPESLLVWAWIIAPDSSLAAHRLSLYAARQRALETSPKPLPVFLFLLLISRRHIHTASLKLLAEYARCYLPSSIPPAPAQGGFSLSQNTSPTAQLGTDALRRIPLVQATHLLLLAYLLHHARRVWPNAIPHIVDMILGNVGPDPQVDRKRLDPEQSTRLSHYFNCLLRLLAFPAAQSPYDYVPLFERAQFSVIRHMSHFDPPLAITRDGYRAVATVQLARHKTPQEQSWEEQQSMSWPPWREAKLGIDADDFSGATSRAAEVIYRMQEAGYNPRKWDQSAAIHAGWDVDNTPTIRTRVYLPITATKIKGSWSATDVWAARITATRTVEEAWANFLAHAVSEHGRSEAMYSAMFRKISRANLRATIPFEDASLPMQTTAFRDDGQSSRPNITLLTPESVHLYFEPPSCEVLFQMMIGERLRPSIATVANLVAEAWSLSSGITYLRDSKVLPRRFLDALVGYRSVFAEGGHVDITSLRMVPPLIFYAFIKLLCRLPPYVFMSTWPFPSHSPPDWREPPAERVDVHSGARLPTLLARVCRLVYVRNVQYPPPWSMLLSTLASKYSTGAGAVGAQVSYTYHDVLCWRLIRETAQRMTDIHVPPDQHAFRSLCRGLEKCTLASRMLLQHRSPQSAHWTVATFYAGVAPTLPDLVQPYAEAEEVLRSGLRFLKAAFASLTGAKMGSGGAAGSGEPAAAGRDPPISASALPALLSVPTPATLHVFIRVLGLYRDYAGLEALVRFMVAHAAQLSDAPEPFVGDDMMSRRALTALRLALEGTGGLETFGDGAADTSAATEGPSSDMIARVKQLVNNVEEWGGWPYDYEVCRYLENSRR